MKKNTAINIAISSMKRKRSRYSAGHHAFMRGEDFIFAKRDQENYERITEAIEVLDAARD